MTGSDHFDADDWADFVRNAASAEQVTLMERHLSDGCQSCADAHAVWQSVRDAAATDELYEAPQASLRLAKAIFSIQTRPGCVTRAVEAVKVLFDSEMLPAVAGVRSAGVGRGRKVLYHMGDFLVDVQIEPAREGRRTFVIGQVLSASDGPDGVHGVPVVLLRDLSVIGKGVTNGSGEFHVEFEGPSGNLSVALGLREEGTAVLLGSSSARHS
jgi:hypothetical protein